MGVSESRCLKPFAAENAKPKRLVARRGKPASIRVDNGPEFASRMLDQWTYMHKVEPDFSRLGKPTDNAFNARLCSQCLNACRFLSVADARSRIDA